MLKAGDAQVIYPVPAQNIDELSNSKDVEVNKVPSTIAHYVSLNTYKKPLDDIKVRQAFNYAVDKDAYLKVVNAGLGLPLDSIIPSKTVYYKQQKCMNTILKRQKHYWLRQAILMASILKFGEHKLRYDEGYAVYSTTVRSNRCKSRN